MQIHTVRSGDTIFKIARQYATSPMKIIENNMLENPDRLSVGQKLLIFTPTRTYTVRGRDTLDAIADRFGVEINTLLRNNPYLCGREKIYPGQLLAIKHDTPKYGMAAANGYYGKGSSDDKLKMTLPYLSYITISVGKWNGEEIERLFDDGKIVREAEDNNVIPLMRVYADGISDNADKFKDNLILLAKTHGYGGVTLAAYKDMKSEPEKFSEFLMDLKKNLMENDLLLFCEADGNDEIPDIKDICDGYVIMYGRAHLSDIPMLGVGESEIMNRTSEIFEPSKTYIEIPGIAYNGKNEITLAEALKLAGMGGKEILCDPEQGICRFEHNKYRGSRKEVEQIAWESPESIKAKLDLIGELGLMGISFDIETIPAEYLMMFECMFRHTPHISAGNS